MTTAYERVTTALAAKTGYPARNSGNWPCPAHEDRDPSLSITNGDGKVVIHCHAGCSVNDVLAAADLTMRDLFDAPADTKRDKPEILASYEYVDETGTPLFTVHRFAPKDFRQQNADGTWKLNGVRRVPYRLPELLDGVKGGHRIYVTEGEKDADAVVRAGGVATCNPNGAGKWRPDYDEHFRGAIQIVIVADRDEPGYRHAHTVAGHLRAVCDDVIVAHAVSGKDIADHLVAGHTLEQLERVNVEGYANGPDTDRKTEEAAVGTTWHERDLASVIAGLTDGTLTRPAPTVGRRDDGICIFYPGRVNSLFGDSGDGKTFVAQTTAVQEIEAGNHVLWVDFEDDEIGTVGRLLDLGSDPDTVLSRFHYFSPNEPFGLISQDYFQQLTQQHNPTLAVVDSAGEAMSVEGIDPNKDEQVAKWVRRLPRFLAQLGPAVVFVDHTAKARDGALFAIGSQRKRAAVTGAAYLVEVIRELGQGREGRSKLTTAKDRCGNFVRGQKAAEFLLDATNTPYKVDLLAPDTATNPTGDFRPTHLMEKVSRWLEINPGASTRAIDQAKLGKAEYVRRATEILITEARIRTEKQGQAIRHHITSPYREDQETAP
jgi:AAA domain